MGCTVVLLQSFLQELLFCKSPVAMAIAFAAAVSRSFCTSSAGVKLMLQVLQLNYYISEQNRPRFLCCVDVTLSQHVCRPFVKVSFHLLHDRQYWKSVLTIQVRNQSFAYLTARFDYAKLTTLVKCVRSSLFIKCPRKSLNNHFPNQKIGSQVCMQS